MPRRGLAPLRYRVALFGVLLASACLDWVKLQNGGCGDGFVGREEACDDGNRITGDGCSDTCRIEPPYCGDGRIDEGELCDDANSLDIDACIEGCRNASCGDSRLWELTEACDDGNTNAGDGCSALCQLEPVVPGPRCGDGALDPGEVCDDGNESNTDACPKGCSWATCGDGLTRAGVEECDDGNPDKSDGCSQGCMQCGAEPGSYFRKGNAHCYTLHTEALSQARARETCQAEGGDLWTTTSELEAKDAASQLMLSGRFWLGLLTSADGRSWVTGEGTKFTHFAPAEPSAPDGRCVVFEITQADNGWFSEPCASQLGFVCERPPAFMFPENHHAFRLRTGALDVSQARASCQANGGYLAMLESDAERTFVGQNVGLAAWVDASDEVTEGQFVWASGEAVSTAAYAMGQPDDQDSSQGCLFLNNADRLADAACSETRAYLCEFE